MNHMKNVARDLKPIIVQWFRSPSVDSLSALVRSRLPDDQVKECVHLVMSKGYLDVMGETQFWQELAMNRPYLVNYVSILLGVEVSSGDEEDGGIAFLKDYINQGRFDTMNPYGIKLVTSVWEMTPNRMLLYWVLWEDVERRILQWKLPSNSVHIAKNRFTFCLAIKQWEDSWKNTPLNIREDALYQLINQRYKGWFVRTIQEDYERNQELKLWKTGQEAEEWLVVGRQGF